MNAASPAPATQPIPVFDLHCDTADRLSWQTLSGSLRKAAGMHFYGPGDEADPAGCRQLARNHGAISMEKVGATPWAQCFACFVPDELSPEEAVAFEAHVSAYLADQVADADLVITGEGRIDSQTIHGKVPVGVAKVAKRFNKPVIGIAGSLTADVGVVHDHGIDAVFSVIYTICTLEDALENAGENVRMAARNIAAVLKVGQAF